MYMKVEVPISERNGQAPNINKNEPLVLEASRINSDKMVLAFGEHKVTVNTVELYAAVECFARLSTRKQ